MPRDGANIYHRPPGTDAITNTTVASAPYNAYVADIEQDLNLPRPIVAGGTGAANAHDAMVALSGEIANQGPVSNYDTFPFVAGSFYSAAGATSAPNPSVGFSGICTVYNSSFMTLEAREFTGADGGRRYVRQKNGGVWGAWLLQAGSVADLDAAYVKKTGDTMTGTLTLAPASGAPLFVLSGAVGQQNDIYSYKGNIPRWLIRMGDAGAESGGNAGSNFQIFGFTDAGAVIGGATALTINRSNYAMSTGGAMTVGGALVANNYVMSITAPTTGSYYFGSSGTKYLTYDGTNFNFYGATEVIAQSANVRAGGHLISNNSVFSGNATANQGTYYFGNSGTYWLSYNGTRFTFNGGPLWVNDNIAINTQTANAGVIYFGSNGAQYLQCDGSRFIFAGLHVTTPSSNNFISGNTASQTSNTPKFEAVYNGAANWGFATYDIYGGGSSTAAAVFYRNSGSQVGQINVTNTTTSYLTSSDASLKNINEAAYDATEAIRIIRADPVRTWNWKSTGESGMGWVAQYSHAVDPDLAVPPPDIVPEKGQAKPEMNWGIDYGKRTPYLWAAVTQLLDRIDTLEAKIAQLEAAA